MNKTCPTCGKHGYIQCEGVVGFDIQSGPLRCIKRATHYVRETIRKTGVSSTTYLCGPHYGLVMEKENRRNTV